MDLPECWHHFEEGLPGEPSFDQDESSQIFEQLSLFQIEQLFPSGDKHLFHLFKTLFRLL